MAKRFQVLSTHPWPRGPTAERYPMTEAKARFYDLDLPEYREEVIPAKDNGHEPQCTCESCWYGEGQPIEQPVPKPRKPRVALAPLTPKKEPIDL